MRFDELANKVIDKEITIEQLEQQLKKMPQGELQEIIIESETFCKYKDPTKQELINAILGRVNVRLNYKILMGTW